MKNSIKLSDIIAESNLSPRVVRAIVGYHGGLAEFKEKANDISKYGANTGISFVYYVDSVKFFRRHAKDLREWLSSLASDCYDTGVLEMIRSWDMEEYTIEEIAQALYSGRGDAVDSVMHTVVICAVEEVANTLENLDYGLGD